MSHTNNHDDEIKDLNDKTDSVSEDIMSEEGDTAETFGELTDLSEEQLEVELLKQQEVTVKLKEQHARKNKMQDILDLRANNARLAAEVRSQSQRGKVTQNISLPKSGSSVPVDKDQGRSSVFLTTTVTVNEPRKNKNLQGGVAEALAELGCDLDHDQDEESVDKPGKPVFFRFGRLAKQTDCIKHSVRWPQQKLGPRFTAGRKCDFNSLLLAEEIEIMSTSDWDAG